MEGDCMRKKYTVLVILLAFSLLIVFGLSLYYEHGVIEINIQSDAVKYSSDENSWTEGILVDINAKYSLKDNTLQGNISVKENGEVYTDMFYCGVIKAPQTDTLLPIMRILIPLEDENAQYSRLLYFSFWNKSEWCIILNTENKQYLVPPNNAKEILVDWLNIKMD